MSKINILTDETISKIAAGEVVERPASVVKELVENSIDAASTSIEIEITSAGQSLIRVADNGEGMGKEDANLAFKRHTTSKISGAGDLERISTLGFRGEALASIAAVSQMDITTCPESEDAGIYAYLEGGEIQSMRPASRSKGTTIEVRNLFYNVPARKKFLKRDSTELAEIVNVVGRFVVARPDIEFKLTHDGKSIIHTPSGMTLGERIRLILGGDASNSMLEVASPEGECAVTGFVSRPSATRKDKRSQMFFLNGRYIRSRVLSDAVYDAYRSLLERGRYPAAVIFLKARPEEVDVNVHPTKLEVKFENERAVKDTVKEVIKSVFDQVKEEPTVGVFEMPGQTDASREAPVIEDSPGVQTEFLYDSSPEEFSLKPQADSPIASVPEGIIPGKREENIFQVGSCFIVQISEKGLTVTDQHAAHERILYEVFSRASEESFAEMQSLLFPVRLDLSAPEAVCMEKFLKDFLTLGFQIEPFGEKSFVVQAAPAILKDRDIKTVIHDCLTDLSELKSVKIDRLDELVKIASCRAAIKEGDSLTKHEMTSLLDELKRCKLPFTCPHGRPTMFDITTEELEKRFRRT